MVPGEGYVGETAASTLANATMRATEEARNVLIETILDVYIEGKFDAMIIKEDERKKKSECIIGKKGKKSKEMDLVSS